MPDLDHGRCVVAVGGRFRPCTTTATSTSASPRGTTSRPGDVRPGGRRSGRRLPRRARRRRTRARARDRDGPDRAPARAARRAGARDRPVEGDGRAAAREAGRRRHRRDDRRLRDDHGRRDVLPRVPRLQHDHEPDDAGGAGRVLPQRGGAPRARRLLRDRGRRPRPPAAPARRDHPRLPRERDALGVRRVRRREPGPDVASLRDRRRPSSSASRSRSATRGPRSST